MTKKSDKMEIYGEIASPGFGEGKSIVLYSYQFYFSNERLINKNEKKKEFKKFQYYVKKTIKKIKKIQEDFPESYRELLEIQIYFLEDPIFHKAVQENIYIEGNNLSYAIYLGSLKLKNFFEEHATDFISQRWIDFQDAIYQLLDEVLGISYIDLCINKINQNLLNHANYILVAEDLSPLLYLKIPKPKGILLKKGSLSGHLTLLAANQGIPILIRAFPEENFEKIQDGQWIVIDTNKAKATIYKESIPSKKEQIQINAFYKDYKILSSNVTISLNADDLEIIKEHHKFYRLSIGLFRTEFIYLKNPKLLFDVEESTMEYSKIYQEMKEQEILTLRLIDVDEDKFSYYFYSSPENRGKRGVEYYRAERKILQNQIKSIFLSLKNLKEMNWELRLLVPMVSNYEDWVFVKELILNEVEDLNPNKKRFVKLGVMLEVPSIMFCVQTLEQEVDFLSIGTNDLLSNFLGKKRNQLTKEDYYEPAFYRMLYLSLKNVKKEISICGNLATYIEFINLLYFIGIRNFSVPYGIYPKIYEYFINFNDKSKFDKQILKELLLKKTKTEFKEALSSITENFVKKV